MLRSVLIEFDTGASGRFDGGPSSTASSRLFVALPGPWPLGYALPLASMSASKRARGAAFTPVRHESGTFFGAPSGTPFAALPVALRPPLAAPPQPAVSSVGTAVHATFVVIAIGSSFHSWKPWPWTWRCQRPLHRFPRQSRHVEAPQVSRSATGGPPARPLARRARDLRTLGGGDPSRQERLSNSRPRPDSLSKGYRHQIRQSRPPKPTAPSSPQPTTNPSPTTHAHPDAPRPQTPRPAPGSPPHTPSASY